MSGNIVSHCQEHNSGFLSLELLVSVNYVSREKKAKVVGLVSLH